jgi:hypothetical protein
VTTEQCPYGQKDCPGGAACVCALPVDTHDPAGYAAFLRERAKANREIADLPREQWPYRPAVLQHWTLRFEQGAELVERLSRERDHWLREAQRYLRDGQDAVDDIERLNKKCGALAVLLYGKPPQDDVPARSVSCPKCAGNPCECPHVWSADTRG